MSQRGKGGRKRGGASFEIIGFWVSYIEIHFKNF